MVVKKNQKEKKIAGQRKDRPGHRPAYEHKGLGVGESTRRFGGCWVFSLTVDRDKSVDGQPIPSQRRKDAGRKKESGRTLFAKPWGVKKGKIQRGGGKEPYVQGNLVKDGRPRGDQTGPCAKQKKGKTAMR